MSIWAPHTLRSTRRLLEVDRSSCAGVTGWSVNVYWSVYLSVYWSVCWSVYWSGRQGTNTDLYRNSKNFKALSHSPGPIYLLLLPTANLWNE